MKELKDGDIIPNRFSECCGEPLKYTSNSGVYIRPGKYCSKCKQLVFEKE